jgi:hypothetical protein
MYRDKKFAIFLLSCGILTIIALAVWGRSYYFLPLTEKYQSQLHQKFSPSGNWGHGLGIIGSVIMLLNFMYSWRKRYEFGEKLGSLKGWLEFHMFVGLFGPALILFHSAFKFQGIIATVSAISMALVVISGIIGRYIYVQIPRSISGLELDLEDIKIEYSELLENISIEFNDDPDLLQLNEMIYDREYIKTEKVYRLIYDIIKSDIVLKKRFREVNELLKEKNISKEHRSKSVDMIKQTAMLSRKISLWSATHRVLEVWRLIHKKLSWLLFLTMLVHVVVTVLFGFTWIF